MALRQYRTPLCCRGKHQPRRQLFLASTRDDSTVWRQYATHHGITNDIGSIFFREAMPADSNAERQAVDDHFRSETTAIPGGAKLDTRLASMLKSVKSASTRSNAASVDRLFAAADGITHTIFFGKSNAASPTLANAMETDGLGLEPSQWMGIAERDELTAKL